MMRIMRPCRLPIVGRTSSPSPPTRRTSIPSRRTGSPSYGKRTRSKGAILAATLAVLVVVLLFAAAVTRALVLHHRQGRLLEQRQQALWLADSALERARFAIAKDATYSGETWRVPGNVLGTDQSGVAVIHVENQTMPRPGRLVRVEAYYPDQGVNRFSFEREGFVDQSRPGGSL